MKYIAKFSIKEENFKAAVARFTQNPPELPKGVTMLGRWHIMGSGDGVALFEADDPVAITRYVLAWADIVDQVVHPVVVDEEIGQALSQM
jgi:uncharacterized protein with GYD domain